MPLRSSLPARAPLYSPGLLHPAVLQTVLWTTVLGLYLMRLSHLLEFPTALAAWAALILVVPFVITALAIHSGAHSWAWKRSSSLMTTPAVRSGLLTILFSFWVAGAVANVVYSHGIPLLWLLQGSGRTYADFGIPSLHGLLDSLLLALALVGFDRYLSTGEWGALTRPAIVVLWSMAIINRQILMTLALELAVLYLRHRRLRDRTLALLGTAGIALIIVFGLIGDARTGRALFYLRAQVISAYPDWLPSGFLWCYTYVVTPFNNFLFNTVVRAPLHDWYLFNTWRSVIPSAFRQAVSHSNYIIPPALVNIQFNVSTGYVNVFQDLGWWGVGGFSALLGGICEVCWLANSRRGVVIYSVVASVLLLSIFVNAFFELPYIFQVFWLVLIYRRTPSSGRPAPAGARRAGFAGAAPLAR